MENSNKIFPKQVRYRTALHPVESDPLLPDDQCRVFLIQTSVALVTITPRPRISWHISSICALIRAIEDNFLN